MDGIDFVFILVAYIVASLIKGLTGLGFSTSCLPIMALQLDLKVAIPLVIFPSVVSNIVIMFQAGRFRDALRRFWPLYAVSIPGLLLGLTILMAINVNIARVVLGLVLVSYSALTLINKPFQLSEQLERRLKVPVGFCTGFINGLTGSQVMPVLPYLMSISLGKNLFVQAINISFTLSSLVMLVGMGQFGYLSPDTLFTAIGSIIPVLALVYASGTLRQRLSGTSYRRLVLIFLLIMGLLLTIRSIL